VKLLDFGIAKVVTGENPGRDFTQAQTVTDATRGGLIAGTAAYMSPEQARGKSVDKRTDIWAFGCVLFEMLSGKTAFSGDTATDTIAAILERDPDWSTLPSNTPRAVRRLVHRCLEKDLKQRLRDIGDARREIENIIALHESKPWRRRTQLAAAAALVLALSPAVLVYLPLARGETVTGNARESRPAVVRWLDGLLATKPANDSRRIESLAVLPLENLSGNPEHEYLAEGVTDALITELGKINTIRVISRTSVLPYKGVKRSLPDIGRELRVDAVVEGSVVRSGDRIRITAQLVQAASDRHLWAQAFERDVHDILSLYADVSEAIATEIHGKIERSTSIVQTRVVDPDALELYTRGRYFWGRPSADNLKKAREYFQQAIDKQGDFASAYAGLADTYLLLGYNRVLSPAEAAPKAKAAALKALELDDSLADAHTSLAGVACTFEADWSAAERGYNRAFELNPNYAIAHQWWGQTLAGLGRHAEAAAEIRRALEIDPVSLRAGNAAGSIMYLARRYGEAIEEYKKTLELDPNYAPTLTGLGRVYTVLGQKAHALPRT
jgi:TolB-like protein